MPTAYKNGISYRIPQKSWDLMPDHKHGFTLTPDTKNTLPPVEVIEFIDKTKKRKNANRE